MELKGKIVTLVFVGMLALAGTARAQNQDDPPGRVGRLSYVDGTVSSRTSDQDQWYEAVVNAPVTTGDAFWTEPNARSEIQVGGIEIRMDQSTEIDVTRLDDNATVLDIPQGTVDVHVTKMPEGGVRITTPSGQVDLAETGRYRIESGQPNGEQASDKQQVAVLAGRASFTAPRASVDIKQGEAAMISGYPPSISIAEAESAGIDDWARSREMRMRADRAPPPRSISPEITGYQDLSSYGDWDDDPQYGALWYPTAVPVDWAPYRDGHWAYVSPWGWTWIDDQPWGFAPFHYGRWVHHHNRWGWYPGTYIARPVYAPALVTFFGGSNFGISLAFGGGGSVGWVPLAPDEPFYPYYHHSHHYRVSVNRTTVNKTVINNITNNTTIINNGTSTMTAGRFRNRDAATVVSSNDFRRGSNARRAARQVNSEQIASAPVVTGEKVAALQPTAEAKAGGEISPGRVNRPARQPENRAVWQGRHPGRDRSREMATTTAAPASAPLAAPAATKAGQRAAVPVPAAPAPSVESRMAKEPRAAVRDRENIAVQQQRVRKQQNRDHDNGNREQRNRPLPAMQHSTEPRTAPESSATVAPPQVAPAPNPTRREIETENRHVPRPPPEERVTRRQESPQTQVSRHGRHPSAQSVEKIEPAAGKAAPHPAPHGRATSAQKNKGKDGRKD